MALRERDAVDYAMVGAVTLLAYLHAPFRPAVRAWLRWAVRSVTAAVGAAVAVLTGQALWLYGLAGLFLGLFLLVALIELPKARGG